MLLDLSARDFIKVVQDLLRDYASPRKLIGSPFLDTDVISNSLISGEYSDSGDRIRTLQAMVRWAVNELAPKTTVFPFGTYKPLDDPSWTDPAWRPYTILRYRYIEPFSSDDLFDGARMIPTLFMRIGLPNRASFYLELNRALRMISEIIRSELSEPSHGLAIRKMLFAQIWQELTKTPLSQALLGIASTFTKAFPRSLLWSMAESEQILDINHHLEHLVSEDLIIELDDGMHMIVPDQVRMYIYPRQKPNFFVHRHLKAAKYCQDTGQLPDQIKHLQRADQQRVAYDLIADNWGILTSRCTYEELWEILQGYQKGSLKIEEWLWVEMFKGSHLFRFGMYDSARELFSRHISGSTGPEGRLMGLIFNAHICGTIDPEAAQRYYEQAELEIHKMPEFSQFLFSSKGRFHLTRGELELAEKNLLQALSSREHPRVTFRSIMYFAFIDLYMLKKDFDQALKYCREHIGYCESEGDAHLYAIAMSSQGRIYMAMGEYAKAMRYLKQSETLHRKRSNNREVSRVLSYRSKVHELSGQYQKALELLKKSLDFSFNQGALMRDNAEQNMDLARLFGVVGDIENARIHWNNAHQAGIELGLEESFFHDLDTLREQIPLPVTQKDSKVSNDLSVVAQKALKIVNEKGFVNTRVLMDATSIGRTTAYKELSELVFAGRLVRVGHGRATHYVVLKNPSDPASNFNGYQDPNSVIVMNYVHKIGHITTKSLQKKAQVSRATAKRILARLVRIGQLKRSGAGRSVRYVIPYT